MVIAKKEQKKTITIDELQELSKTEVAKASGKRQDIAQKINEKYLDANFFFSIVFSSRDERDAWCKEHGLVLRDDEYILAKDYIISVDRR